MLASALTVREAFSGSFGFISLASWIFLLVPQLITNYKNQSGESVSIPFMVIWGIGNGCSFIGVAWAGMPPVIILIQLYFCTANVVTAVQCLYYRRKIRMSVALASQKTLTSEETSFEAVAVESDPLLQRGEAGHIPGDSSNGWIKNSFALLVVVILGVAVWAIAYSTGAWHPFIGSKTSEGQHIPIDPQIFGWVSDVICLGARVPQIVKNARRQSTTGLAILFPLLALLANLTYMLSIVCHSTDPRDLRISSPWLIGCTAAMGMDLAIVAQFFLYDPKRLKTRRITT